jgi:beta-phosphoglucomutase-like phosphatase (HAD superfamily)
MEDLAEDERVARPGPDTGRTATAATRARRVVLCDADGNLFGSEEPAFDASADVTNRFLASLGIDRRYDAQELRLATTGKNFRTTAVQLAMQHGVVVEGAGDEPAGPDRPGRVLRTEELERWVREERDVVGAHLGRVLQPVRSVQAALERLSAHMDLAVVTSSALARIDTCLRASGLAGFFPPAVRYSAEDTLPVPTSKPDPAIYLWALDALGAGPFDAVAVEDSVPGAQSAIAAGVATIGNLVFTPPEERPLRRAQLLEAGVAAVVDSWEELVGHDLLRPDVGTGCAARAEG